MKNINKVAVLIDGGFYKIKFSNLHNRWPTPKDISKTIATIIATIQLKTGNDSTDVLHRVFYYDSLPFDKQIKDTNGKIIDFSKTKSYEEQNRLICALKKSDQLALRLGEVSFDGWAVDPRSSTNKPRPIFRQKGVDMKIGLDMAWMAGKHTVDKIVLVTGDSDFVSPMKFVRKEGILVYLYPMRHKVKLSLIEHSDFIINF